MCGISVLLDTAGSPRVTSRLLAMHSVIRHRGPDGEGFLLLDAQGSVTRADSGRRVARSRDPANGLCIPAAENLRSQRGGSAADGQRRSDDLGRFNGEIYNFRELRAELEAKGRAFRTSGDTEVVLAAFEEWGERCFARLDGMWAIVILDLRRNRLVVVARPLRHQAACCWSIDDDGAMLFASEIKQILAAMSRASATRRTAR